MSHPASQISDTPSAPRPVIMTVADVAAYLRLSTSTVYRMAHQGELPAIRVGGQWRFHQDAIEGLLHPQQTVPKGGNDETVAKTS